MSYKNWPITFARKIEIDATAPTLATPIVKVHISERRNHLCWYFSDFDDAREKGSEKENGSSTFPLSSSPSSSLSVLSREVNHQARIIRRAWQHQAGPELSRRRMKRRGRGGVGVGRVPVDRGSPGRESEQRDAIHAASATPRLASDSEWNPIFTNLQSVQVNVVERAVDARCQIMRHLDIRHSRSLTLCYISLSLSFARSLLVGADEWIACFFPLSRYLLSLSLSCAIASYGSRAEQKYRGRRGKRKVRNCWISLACTTNSVDTTDERSTLLADTRHSAIEWS